MHQYGEQGFCLVWAVNNALQQTLLNKNVIVRELMTLNDKNKNRNKQHYVNREGINFRSFKKVIKDIYGVGLRKVKTYSMKGRYILTYDFGKYLHTVALVDGKLLDSERGSDLSIDTKRKLVDVYKVIR
jgi:predicted transcriptional regulator